MADRLDYCTALALENVTDEAVKKQARKKMKKIYDEAVKKADGDDVILRDILEHALNENSVKAEKLDILRKIKNEEAKARHNKIFTTALNGGAITQKGFKEHLIKNVENVVRSEENYVAHRWKTFLDNNTIVHDGNTISLMDYVKLARNDLTLQENFVNEMKVLAGDANAKQTGDKGAKQIAEFYTKLREEYRAIMSNSGVDIRYLEGYEGKATQSRDLVQKMTDQEYADFLVNKLDWQAMKLDGLDLDKKIQFLKRIHSNVVDGDTNVYANGIYISDQDPSGVNAKSWEATRKLKYKDAQSYMEAMGKIGQNKAPLDSAISDSLKLAHDSMLMDTMGYDVGRNYKELKKDYGFEKDEVFPNLDSTFMNITGEANMIGSHKHAVFFANITGDTRKLITMGFLSDMIFSLKMLSDVAIKNTQIARAGGQRMSIARSITDTFKTFKDANDQKMFLSTIDVSANSFMARIRTGANSRFGDDFSETAMSSLLQEMYDKSLITGWEGKQKISTTAMLSHIFHNSRNKTFKEFMDMQSDSFKLDGFGITEQEWDVFRTLKGQTDNRGKDYLHPDAIREMTDKQIVDAFFSGSGNVSQQKINNKRREMTGKFTAFMNNVINNSILTPDANTRALTNLGFKRGTWAGEATRTTTHLMSFPLMVLNNVIVPMAKEKEFARLAWTMSQMIALGAVSTVATDLYRGKTRDYFSDDPAIQANFAMDAIARSGALSVPYDLLYSYVRYNKGMEGTFGGTTYGFAEDLLNIPIQGARAAADLAMNGGSDGEVEELLSDTMKLFRERTPFNDFPVFSQLVDSLLYYPAMEKVDPESYRRIQQYWNEKTGGENIFM